jgi:drug/metabolite transporter (DMT)-like permease
MGQPLVSAWQDPYYRVNPGMTGAETTKLLRRTAGNSLGALLMMLAMLGFAGMDALSKWLVKGYPIGQMLWIRTGVFCLFAWLVVRRRGFRQSFHSRRPLLQAARALIALVESGIFVLSFAYLPLADTHAIAATSPLIVIALGAIFLREKVDAARWLAVAAGFLAVLLIVRPGFRALDWPLLLPLAGALLWGSYQILTRAVAQADTPDTTLVWSAFVAFLVTCVVGPLHWQWPDALGWTLLLATAVINALANYALIRALDYAEASAIQPYAYTLLVWVAILGLVMFGDFPDGWTLFGAAIIVASGLYTWHHDRRLASAAMP